MTFTEQAQARRWRIGFLAFLWVLASLVIASQIHLVQVDAVACCSAKVCLTEGHHKGEMK